MDVPQIRAQLEQLHLSAYGWALHCCGRERTLTEEVLQIVYLNVLEGKAQFDGRSAFKTWLFAVIRKTAAAEWRRRIFWEFRFRFFNDAEDPPSDESIELSIHASEERRMFRRALLRLPHRQQEVLHLVFYQDLTIEETAAALEISVGSVRTHYERGKKRLRSELEQMEAFNESRIA
jgi:RNA polymerase sigma factor (sigma-70 family)